MHPEDGSAAARGGEPEVCSLDAGCPCSDASEERRQAESRAVPGAWGLEGRADEGDLVRPRSCWKEGGEGGSSGTFSLPTHRQMNGADTTLNLFHFSLGTKGVRRA